MKNAFGSGLTKGGRMGVANSFTSYLVWYEWVEFDGTARQGTKMKEVLRILQELKPDIITITGDYVNFKPDELSVTFNELAQLSAPLGVYGSLGNHDHYMTDLQHALLKNTISKTGIQLLVNDSVNIPVHNTFLNIAERVLVLIRPFFYIIRNVL